MELLSLCFKAIPHSTPDRKCEHVKKKNLFKHDLAEELFFAMLPKMKQSLSFKTDEITVDVNDPNGQNALIIFTRIGIFGFLAIEKYIYVLVKGVACFVLNPPHSDKSATQ